MRHLFTFFFTFIKGDSIYKLNFLGFKDLDFMVKALAVQKLLKTLLLI